MYEDRSKDELERDYYLRLAGGKDAFAGQVVSGTTTVVTPSAGRRLEVLWVYALTDPDSATTPLITVTLGVRALYSGYAIAHREVFVGGVNETLSVTLSEAAPVAVTIHYREL